jgi:hypothetical protein
MLHMKNYIVKIGIGNAPSHLLVIILHMVLCLQRERKIKTRLMTVKERLQ